MSSHCKNTGSVAEPPHENRQPYYKFSYDEDHKVKISYGLRQGLSAFLDGIDHENEVRRQLLAEIKKVGGGQIINYILMLATF